jgi:transposase
VSSGCGWRPARVRQAAAQMIADGKSAVDVAALLEVSTKSAYQWRRAWVTGGAQALASKGPAGPDPKLSDELSEPPASSLPR